MIDTYTEYLQLISSPECEAAWRVAAECVGKVDYSMEGCAQAIPMTSRVYWGDGTQGPSDVEKQQAIDMCLQGGEVSGTRGRCTYFPNTTFDPGDCMVMCQDTPYGYFEITCGGLPGLPLQCDCHLNGYRLYDDGIGYPKQFLAADCRDAALRAVEGECLERVDCCFIWPGPETPPQEHCSCTPDPGLIGYDTCEAAAKARGGQVVELCPQYLPNPGCLQSPELCP